MSRAMSGNVVLISSSPATDSRRVSAFFGRSSSPDFPTIQELLSQQPKEPKSSSLRSGSQTAPNPDDPRHASTNANSLLHQGGEVTSAMEPVDAGDASTSLIEISLDVFKKPAKPRSKPDASAEGSKAQGPSATSRKGASSNGKAGKGKGKASKINSETDVSATSKPTRARKKKTGTVTEEEINAPLNLDAASRRREAWTPPPKDTAVLGGSRSSDPIEILSSTTKETDVAMSREMFKNLQEMFGFDTDDGLRTPTDLQDGATVLAKRKLIEMVSTTTASAPVPAEPEKSPMKQKAPKKKPRTITGLATEAYAPKGLDDPPQPGSVDQFIGTNKGAPNAAASKTKAKAKKGAKGSKKKEDPRMVLLSPKAALKQVAKQDFVFGTSSQLAREEDAELLRDLQAAIQNSNRIDDGVVDTPLNSDAIEPPEQRPRMWNAASRDEEGDLMDLEIIDLVDSPAVEVAKDDTDPFGYGLGTQGASQRRQRQGKDTATAMQDSPLVGRGLLASSGSSAVPRNNSKLFSGTPASQRTFHTASSNSGNAEDLPDASTTPPPSSQKRLPRSGLDDLNSIPSTLAKTTAAKGRKPPAEVQRPNFELMTDAQLSRQISSYGFKLIKKREAMIALLDECWTSKHQPQAPSTTPAYSTMSAGAMPMPMPTPAVSTSPADPASKEMAPPTAQPTAPKRARGQPRNNSVSSVASTELPPAAQAPVSPSKRPRGRPKKNSVTAVAPPSPKKPQTRKTATPKKKTAYLLEIPDSESEPASSPERLFSSSPPAFDISLATEDDTQLSLAMSPTAQQSGLFVHITKAVTSAPPSKDPAHPSWHEKILLYDPIILEDLAAWLNTGQLSRLGYDGEVSPQDVKKWCESKSVCCLWRKRGGGKERKRL